MGLRRGARLPPTMLGPSRKAVSLLILCLAGVWQGCEASSAGGDPSYSSETCSDACSRVAAADCGDVGEGCFDACVSFPTAQFQGDCQLELKSYFGCWWSAPAFACNDALTTPLGCEEELETYSSCLSPGAGGAAGAGGAENRAAAGADPAGGAEAAGRTGS